MLLSFSFRNFQSFADRAEVSFVLDQRDTVHGWDRLSPSGERLSTAMAVMGANGAGKTSVLQACTFLAWFLKASFDLPPAAALPLHPHMALDGPSEFTVEADGDDAQWSYRLTITRERVWHESLYRKPFGAGRRPRFVFKRDWDEGRNAYAIKQQDFGLAETEAAKVRPNVSLISWGRQYGAEMASQVASFLLTSNLNVHGRHLGDLTKAAEFFETNPSLKDTMRSLLKGWDLGLHDVRIRKFENPKHNSPDETEGTWYPLGVHHARDTVFELGFGMESSGTQTAFMLLPHLLSALAGGGIAVIDELESDLHPHMVEPILRLFHDQQTNPHGAQIIFTCHSPEVLKLLQRSQVTFVEKAACESIAYRGDQIEGLTSQHNLYAKYMAGALGAVPRL